MFPGTHAAVTPDKLAVVMAGSGQQLTYRELEEGSARLARHLLDAGLERGDVVALISDNDPRVFEVYWATRRSGLYITVVNHHLTPDEAAYIVRDSGAKAVVVSAAVGELAAAVGAQVPAVPVRLAFGGPVAGFADYDTELAGVSSAPLADQPCGEDMLYSSGTTGRPKGVRPRLPKRQVDEPGDMAGVVVSTMYGFDADTVYLSPAPLYHAAPLRFSARVQQLGGTVVVMERFEPVAALAAIERHRATHSQWVPTMLIRLLKLPAQVKAQHDLSSHRVAIHAAAPCPVDVKRSMIEWWGPIVHEYYSSTEGAGITFVNPTEAAQRPGTVGKALVGTIHICDDTGAEVGQGEVGTIFFERDAATFEYHNDPEKTRGSRHPQHDNWATCGDLGHVDADGYLYLVDRKGFTIISGGVNIYPREIEDVLALHPAVLDVAVIGEPDGEMGESVLAVVQPAATAQPGPELAEELIAHVRGSIATFKAPRRVEFTDDLPRTPTGKLVKQKLRERYATTSG
ncbi:acyl-CoA synthetase [Pseudonocardia sp. TRM90224]|uniref:acyl-CoA synthetase n=1 Tax=Pseudonocardia sp. TRM90224 TaxID=2812678 RepID=UPI001E487B58|nr:acyl-CoA synthetase [Pseudonocardia sp. TRM90224]